MQSTISTHAHGSRPHTGDEQVPAWLESSYVSARNRPDGDPWRFFSPEEKRGAFERTARGLAEWRRQSSNAEAKRQQDAERFRHYQAHSGPGNLNRPPLQFVWPALEWRLIGAPSADRLLLAEGAASEADDLLRIARALTQKPAPFHVLLALTGSSEFTPAGLSKLQGMRVRMVADNDRAGNIAAARWLASLRKAGCLADAWELPGRFRSLGDALRDIPADADFWNELLTF